MRDWYKHPFGEVMGRLEVDRETGLQESEVLIRRRKYGLNELVEKGGRGPWMILADQFKETMVIVLIVAVLLSVFLGDLKDAVAIAVIIGVNALLGFHQENRAEKAIGPKKMAVPRSGSPGWTCSWFRLRS
jgi:Ca2+-transporting ATPase